MKLQSILIHFCLISSFLEGILTETIYYIADNQCISSCDGSIQNPFKSFIDATSFIFKNISANQASNITIIFRNKTNEISDQDVAKSPYNSTNGLVHIFFNYSLMKIEIKSEGNENADLIISSNNFQIFVPNSLILTNIRLQFNDTNATANSPIFFVLNYENSQISILNSSLICFKSGFSTLLGTFLPTLKNIDVQISDFSIVNAIFPISSIYSLNAKIDITNITIIDSILANSQMFYFNGSLNTINFSGIQIRNISNFLFLNESNNCSISNFLASNTLRLFSLNRNNYFSLSYLQTNNVNIINSGGLIKGSQSNLITIVNSLFVDFITQKHGGIIDFSLDGNSITFENCSFENISANYGGILSNNAQSEIYFRSCNFKNIISNWGGIAVISNSLIQINNCYFENLTAGEGSVLYTNQSQIEIDNIIINSSYSFYTVNGSSGFSGGVFFFNSTNVVTMSNSIILNCSNVNEGGVFHFETNNLFNFNNLFIFNSSSISYSGCGYFYLNNSGTIDNLTLMNSSSVLGMGLTFDSINEVTISNSLFINIYYSGDYTIAFDLQVYETSTVMGTISLLYSNILTVVNSSFLHIIGQGGSGITSANQGVITLNNVTFDDHVNINNDGCIVVQEGSTILIIDNCKFQNSQSYNGPAIMNGEYVNLTISISHFENLSTYDYDGALGGAIYVWRFNNLIVNDSFFLNTKGATGGCVYMGEESNGWFYNTVFTNGAGGAESGAIGGWMNNQYYVYNSTFINMKSQANGGTFSIDTNSYGYFENVTVINSSASALGGTFVMLNNDKVILINSTFDTTVADLSGGFAHLGANIQLLIQNCRITNSYSLGLGGVFFISESNIVNLISNVIGESIFQGDGVIFFAKYSNVINDSNSIYSDFSSEDENIHLGGINAIFNNSLNLNNITFETITSVYSGGIIYMELANNVSLSTIYLNNLSTIFMGTFAFFIDLNTINLTNINADNLTTEGFGAFAYLFFSNNFQISDSFISNTQTLTHDGGIFYLKDTNSILLNRVNFENVSCQGSGAIAYLSTYNIFNSNMSNIKNSLAEGIGDFIFSENNNEITINFTNFDYSQPFGKDAQSNFIYAGIKSSFVLENINASMNCFGDGCLVSAFRFNTIVIRNTTFSNFFASNDFSLFYLYTDNQLSINDSGLVLGFTGFSSILISCYQNNSVNLSSNNFSLVSLTKFFESLFYNKMKAVNVKVDPNSNIDLVFDLNSNSTLILQKFYVAFSIQTNLVKADSSTIYMQKLDLIKPNSNLIFDIQDCKISIRKSTFISQNRIGYVLLRSNSSQIIMSKVLVFGFRADGNLSVITFSDLFENISMKNNIYLSNRGFYGGVIKIVVDPVYNNLFKNVTLQRNSFILNKALQGGGIYYISNLSKMELTISNSSFYGNKAEAGGSLYLTNPDKISIVGNTFKRSKAISVSNVYGPTLGGCIYYSDYNDSMILNITKNNFSNNMADIGGVLYLKTIPKMNFSHNNFEDNMANFYGPNLASLIERMSFIDNLSLTPLTTNFINLDNVISGYYYAGCLFQLWGLDKFGNIAFYNNETLSNKIEIVLDEKNLSNSISYSHKNGSICFDGPFTRKELPVKSSFHYSLIFNQQTSIPSNFSLNFRGCQIGERLTEDFECIECEIGTYSFSTDFSQSFTCSSCQDYDPFVCEGGNKLHPKNDYWRIGKDSDNFQECIKPDICYSMDIADILQIQPSIDNAYYAGYCKTGYSGPLCNICSEGYGKVDKTTCVECENPENWYFFLFIFIKIFLKLLYTFYCVFIGFKMMVSIISNQFSKDLVVAIGLLKVLLIHFQILSFLIKLPLQWTSNLQTALPVLFSIAPDMSDAFSFECFLKIYNKSLENAYLVIILCPIYIFVMYLVSLAIVFIKKANFKRKKVIDQISNFQLALCILFIIIMFSYIDIGKTNLEMFQCINIGSKNENELRLVNDMNIDCNSAFHQTWIFSLAVPVLVISSAIILYLIFKLFYSYYHKKLREKEVKFALGYFYFAYKPELFFWDIVILIRRVLILFVFMYFYEKIFFKNLFPLILIYFIIVASLLLQAYFNPFFHDYDILNKAELGSLFTLAVTYIVTIFYSTSWFKNWNFTTQYFDLLIAGIIILNVAYIIYWCILYYSKYLKHKMTFFVMKTFAIVNEDAILANSLISFNEYLDKNKYLSDYKLREEKDLERYLMKDVFGKLQEKLSKYDIKNPSYPENQYLNLTTEEKNLIQEAIKSKRVLKIDRKNLKNLFDTEEANINNMANFSTLYPNIIEIKYKRGLKFSNYIEYYCSDTIRVISNKPIDISNYGIYCFEDKGIFVLLFLINFLFNYI